MGRPFAAIRAVALTVGLFALIPARTAANDTGAAISGVWSSAATWTNGVPGPNDNALIGSNYPTGAVPSATVTLTQNSAADGVYLGYGSGTSGTLDLHGFNLAVNNLYFGFTGGTGSIVRTGGGTLAVGNSISLYAGNLSLAAGDTTPTLNVYNSSTATTTATGNVTTSVLVDQGATLNLGADLALTSGLDVRGTVNAAGHAITAPNVTLGYYNGPAAISNRGALTVGNNFTISAAYSPALANFALQSGDAIANLYLYSGAGVTTAATGNITGSANLDPGTTLTLGADLSLSGSLDLRGTLAANGHAISASTIYLGLYNGPASITNRGAITTSNLYVSSQASPGLTSFALTPADTVSNFSTYGVDSTLSNGVSLQSLSLYSNGNATPRYSTVTTTTTGNVTGSVLVDSGNTVILGADLALTSGLDVRGTVNAAGHAITAPNLVLGYYNGPAAITNRGPMTIGNLTISAQYSPGLASFPLNPADVVNNLYVYGGAGVTTTATGNITSTASVDTGSTLNLGADLSVNSSVEIRGTLNANGHAISSPSVVFGFYGGPYVVNNRGPITASNLTVSSAYSPSQTSFNLTPADSVAGFYLYGVDSTLPAGVAVQSLSLLSNGSATPRYSTAATTTTGNVTSSVFIDPGNTLNLGADLTLTNSLDLRGNLNANGHAITAPNVIFGYYNGPAALTNRGPINASNLTVSSAYSPGLAAFNPAPADNIANLYLYGVNSTFPTGASVQGLNLYSNGASVPTFATATTSATGNVTQSVYTDPGTTLDLQADLNVAGSVDIRGTVNANNHGITAPSIAYGYYNGPAVINNRGPISTNSLSVSSQYSPALGNLTVYSYDSIGTLGTNGVNTSFGPGASVQNLYLSSTGSATPAPSTATTSGVGNVTNYVYDAKANTLNLGADLILSQGVDNRGTVNANGHGITTQYLYNGVYDGPAAMNNLGVVTTYNYSSDHGSSAYFTQPGSHINTTDLTGNSLMYVYDAVGQTSGLTLDGSDKSNLTIDPGSMMMLEVNGLSPGWVFRWADPTAGGDHVGDLQSLINGGEIGFTPLNGGNYSLFSDGTYTYIAVPEPSALLLTAAAGLFIRRRRKK
jgi:hypothetical protein